jgi:hypothetical protein
VLGCSLSLYLPLNVALFFLLLHLLILNFVPKETKNINASNGGKPARKPYYLYGFRNPSKTINQKRKHMFFHSFSSEGRNLHPEKSQDYASKPQRKGTFMNSASCPSTVWLQYVANMKNLFYLKLYEKSLSHAASYTIKNENF